MNKEIIIHRKKSKNIEITIVLFLATVVLIFPIIIHFTDIPWITSDVPLYIIILSGLCAPVCAFCTIGYFKEIFNEKPVLIVNEIGIIVNEFGINEEVSYNSVGMIKWEDIQNINIIPYTGKTYFICISLKTPEKYIENQKLLNKLNRQSTTNKWGHISFSSLYFKKEFKEVIEIMQYYFAQHNKIN